MFCILAEGNEDDFRKKSMFVFFFNCPFFFEWTVSVWLSQNPTDAGKLPVLLKWCPNRRNTAKAMAVLVPA